jgi:cytochrome-b5 reductase
MLSLQLSSRQTADFKTVYDVTSYVRDHPGGADILIDSAGRDATEDYTDVGHSEDADEILETFHIGNISDAPKVTRPKNVRIISQKPVPTAPRQQPAFNKITLVGSVLGATIIGYAAINPKTRELAMYFSNRFLNRLRFPNASGQSSWLGGFAQGCAIATVVCSSAAGYVVKKLNKMLDVESGFMKYPPYMKSRTVRPSDPHLQKGILDPKEYKPLPLVEKERLSSNVFRFVFQLPDPEDVVGIPIGQHVAIKATIDGQAISRSYTPISNNLDRGRMELLIKCYPDGKLTSGYLEKLEIGDEVMFRGPKGAMKYTPSMCKRIGMIAGGTGITPMYQLIRAICEHETDTTEISLIYANRTEEDIMLRNELEAFARKYPKNFKLWYMLDQPPANWAYGSGYVTPAVMAEHLPGPSDDTAVMLCGPPGMIAASKKGLVSAGFREPGAVSKPTDQIFCF